MDGEGEEGKVRRYKGKEGRGGRQREGAERERSAGREETNESASPFLKNFHRPRIESVFNCAACVL